MSTHPHPFDIAPVSKRIWEQKYQFKDANGVAVDRSIDETWARVAGAAASVERGAKRAKAAWAAKFAEGMSDFGFLPAGRIIAGAGTKRDVTLFNCFVMGRIDDDLGAIFDSVREAALTMQAGGGVGHDFSTLRPKGALVRSIGADASGPVSFMDVWDAMCRTIMSAGSRRGAMMATMRCDHPDIAAFIAAKSDARRLRNFNLSVLVTDAFVAAVRDNRPWDLIFNGQVYATVDASALWDQIMRATYDYAEPGVIFIDRINAANNLAYCEEIHATNPCGEQPLPAYGACLLGSINMARFVDHPFQPNASLDIGRIEERVRLAVRFLDNVIDVSHYPLKAQAGEARAKRRMGLGVTGLADALIMCGQRYGSTAAVQSAETWMAVVQNAAYVASAELAAEKGAFPLYDRAQFNARPNVQGLSSAARSAVEKHGVRNGCLTSIAPTGTISLLGGNVSSGIEPVFDFAYARRILEPDGQTRTEHVEDYAHALFNRLGQSRSRAAFVTVADLKPSEHVAMQAAVQRHVDSSISKTINCPADISFAAFKGIYLEAYEAGLKGCTTFRPNAVTGSVLTSEAAIAGEAAVPPIDAGRVPVQSAIAVEPPHALGRVPDTSTVVYMAKPLERETVLGGYTYKLSWPGQSNALYVTINDMERAGRLCPFEIFINTKNLEHYAWTVALTRMISAIFRRGGDVAFVAEELKAIFDPQGGRWMEGRYVPSLLAAIGEVIELHMVRIGFMPGASRPDGGQRRQSQSDTEMRSMSDQQSVNHVRGIGGKAVPVANRHSGNMNRDAKGGVAHEVGPVAIHAAPSGRFCPRCSNPTLLRIEGCWSCQTCGYAHCD